MTIRPAVGGLALVLTLAAGLVAGCSSSASKPGAPSSGPAVAVSAAELSAGMTAVLRTVTSAHVAVDAGILGGTSTVDVQLADGTTTATDVRLTQSGQDLEVVTVDGKSYAKAATSGKPWTLVSATSSNPVVKAFASSVNVAGVISQLTAVVQLIGTGTDTRRLGTDQVDGTAAVHYSMTIDPKSGGTAPGLTQILASLGNTPLPIQLWLDAQSRPVRVSLAIPLGAKPITITATISNFNAPLTISAPAADQVATD